MTTDEKLQHFQKNAMNHARAIRSKIVDDYTNRLQEIYNEHVISETRKADLKIQIEKDDLRRHLNSELSKESMELKASFSKRHATLVKELFEEACAKLVDFMKTAAYVDLLEKQIHYILNFAGELSAEIYLNASDIALKEQLAKKTNATLLISDEDFIGGTKAMIPATSVLIDHSFLTSLTNMRSNYQLGGISNE